jgi:hypothetical protein
LDESNLRQERENPDNQSRPPFLFFHKKKHTPPPPTTPRKPAPMKTRGKKKGKSVKEKKYKIAPAANKVESLQSERAKQNKSKQV